jgi:hypothetical protein
MRFRRRIIASGVAECGEALAEERKTIAPPT